MRIQRTYLLAAALTIVGVAGLGFALFGLLTESELGTASDDPLIFSIGDVPAPVGVVPVERTPAEVAFPDLPERRDVPFSTGAGKITRGLDLEVVPGDEASSERALEFSGRAVGGVRKAELTGIEPARIQIPKINVDAPVVQVGTTAAGAMEAPARYSEVGWWSFGAQPGEAGRAVLAGHVDSPWGAAVFIRLEDLEPGDEIIVSDVASELRYVVRGVAVYRADSAPVEDIFGPSAERELILITCGGWFDRSTASYVHRRVIFAVLADESPAVSPRD